MKNFFGGVIRLGLKTSGCVISFHDTIYQTVMYCGVFLVNGFPPNFTAEIPFTT